MTMDQAATELEQYIADREDSGKLQAFVRSMNQVGGTLTLVQVDAAKDLAKTIVKLAESLDISDVAKTDEQLGLITQCIFVLPRYLEYLLQTQKALPVLLIPQINEVRKSLKLAPFYDSHFFEPNFERPLLREGSAKHPQADDLAALIKRIRHMYQLGLLGVLQKKQVKPSLGMMLRSMERMSIIQGGAKLYPLWYLAARAVEKIASEGLEITHSRKRVLSALDRELKQAIKGSVAESLTPAHKDLLGELLYILALSGSEDAKTNALLKHFDLAALPYSDAEIRKEREALKGPSADTLQSMAAVLHDELKLAKEILERASEGGISQSEDLNRLIDTLQKVAEILAIVGLVAPGAALKKEITNVVLWHKQGQLGSDDELLHIADVLLYVESAVSSMGNHNLSDDRLAKANNLERKDVMAQSQLAEAEIIVIGEAESGLSLVKRALSSFAESGYDRAHINNVSVTLNAIRGVMAMLALPRGEAVVSGCIDFVETTLLEPDASPAMDQLLETFADAVISLEYYLDGIKGELHRDDKVLEIAEESLTALGFPVVG